MLSTRTFLLLLGLIALALACAPHHPERKHGWCKFYVDGKSDFDTARRKRDSGSGSGSGEGGKKRYNRSKKRKDKKCYEYEDGSKDNGAELEEGVTYTVTITKN